MEPRIRDRRSRRAGHEVRSETGRAVVLGPYPRSTDARGPSNASAARSPAARIEEAAGLARAIDLDVVYSGAILLASVTPATFIGKGKVDEVAGVIKVHNAGLVVMDCALSPVQQRNLEKAWGAKVVDRTGLILEIFGRRARTREGALQVEHAHLSYQKSRLVRSWTHLERQRGGFGFLGGPGETQIEADRRVIAERLARIEAELEKVKRTRKLHRASRKRVPYPIIAFVGYTNAGKSTLFNRMTQAAVLSADMLFATLDPTLRSLDLPHGLRVILSDTVGFISDLPTTLVAAFRATLEEVLEADLILHVQDISHGDSAAQAADVANVLRSLGIEPEDPRILMLWNKTDLLDADARLEVANLAARMPAEHRPVMVSAATGEGIDTLLAAIESRLTHVRTVLDIVLDPADGASASWLHRNAEVLDRVVTGTGQLRMTVRLDPSAVGLVRAKFGAAAQIVRRAQ